jgi:hypothetical protein
MRLETGRPRIRNPRISDLPGWHRLLPDAETMYRVVQKLRFLDNNRLKIW